MKTLLIAALLFTFISVEQTTTFSDAKLPLQSPADVSLSYGLVVDNSGSLHSQFSQVRSAAKTIAESTKSGDEGFIIKFVDSMKIETVQELTQDSAKLVTGTNKFSIEGGQTALLDAVYLSATYLAEKGQAEGANRRHALILITDGGERYSYYKVQQVLDTLHRTKVRDFAIGMTSSLLKDEGKKKYEKAIALLNLLSTESGGKALFPADGDELQKDAKEILNSIRND